MYKILLDNNEPHLHLLHTHLFIIHCFVNYFPQTSRFLDCGNVSRDLCAHIICQKENRCFEVKPKNVPTPVTVVVVATVD